MKTYIVLCLYDALLGGEKVSRVAFCAEHNICERTFYRYIKEIGEFLMHCKSKYLIAVEQNDTLESKDSLYHFVAV